MNTTRALLDAYYAAFNAGDWNGMLALLSDDVAHDINQGRRELGKPAFALFLERMATSYQEELVDLTHCISDDGTRAATEFVVLGRYVQTDEGLPPASGQNYRLPGGAFFEVRANKITRVSNYYNLEDWLAQVRRA